MEHLNTVDILMLAVQVLLGLVAFFGAQAINNLKESIKELKEFDKAMIDKLDLYVRKDDLGDIKRQIGGIFERLEDIKDKVSEKVSRSECANKHGSCQ